MPDATFNRSDLTTFCRIWIRLQATWPWARYLAAAFARLALIPAPS